MNEDEQNKRHSALKELKAEVARMLEESSDEIDEILKKALDGFKTAQNTIEINIAQMCENTESFVQERAGEINANIQASEERVRRIVPPCVPGWWGRWERLKWLWSGRD